LLAIDVEHLLGYVYQIGVLRFLHIVVLIEGGEAECGSVKTLVVTTEALEWFSNHPTAGLLFHECIGLGLGEDGTGSPVCEDVFLTNTLTVPSLVCMSSTVVKGEEPLEPFGMPRLSCVEVVRASEQVGKLGWKSY